MVEEKILETINKYNLIQEKDKIVIGVSGGPDSMCLLDILCCLKEYLKIDLIVAHVNHMIRQEAEEETKYVEEYCKKNNIPFFAKYVDVIKMAKKQKIGTEEMGRKVRYDFFEEIAKKQKANKIATAHNANDNAETILMNILRGSGISGLKGIEIKREGKILVQNDIRAKKFDGQKLEKKLIYIRPLRECNRKEIEKYCKEKNLNPKIDKSNLENIYTRNKIRNELIPYLQKEFNSNIIETFNRMSDLARDEDEYFKQVVENAYETLKTGENNLSEQTKTIKKNETITLDLKKFNKLPKVVKSKLLLYAINEAVGTTQGIAKIHIEDIIKLCENNIGNKYLTPNKMVKVLVKGGKVYLSKNVAKV